jgi:tetratricopeptide (TPR) repeat protein
LDLGLWTPKITDFGLAKLLDVQTDLTPAEALLGTPCYMAPEQAAGWTKALGPAVDIYGLGNLLYELLTGRPPFQEPSILATLDQVRSLPPVPPARLQAKVPDDLQTICLKCLEKEPHKRYATARELAEDLRRFQEGKPIRARPAQPWERLLKWARRRPTAAALAGVILLTALAIPADLKWNSVNMEATTKRARSAERQAFAGARSRYQQFVQRREDALFYGLYGMLPPDGDRAVQLGAARVAAQDALTLVGVDVDSQPAPRLDPRWSDRENADITVGCYQCLLIVADAVAQPAPQLPKEEQRRRISQALAILDNAGRLAPLMQAHHLRKALYLDWLGEKSAAVRERECARAMTPAGAIDYLLLGQEHLRLGGAAQALVDFQNALRLQPDDFWTRFHLAFCSLKLGRRAEAVDGLTWCLEQRPGFIWAYLLRGFAQGQQLAFAAAEADFQKAAELGPQGDARYVLACQRGVLRFAQGRYADARGDFQEAIALKPMQYQAHVNLAQVHRKLKQPDAEAAELALVIRLQPPALVRAEYHAGRSQALYLQKKYEEALKACDEALHSYPDSAVVHGLRGQALLQLGRFRDALGALDQNEARGGKAVGDFYRGRGWAREQLRDYLGAKDDYSRALELEPDAELYRHRGWAYFFADAWKPALRDFEEAVRLDLESSDARIGRGLAHVMLGEYRAAVVDAEQALRMRPDTPAMMHNIACVFSLAAASVERDAAAAARQELGTRYRARAIDSIHQTLALLPPAERRSFWRQQVSPDAALDPVRRCPDFLRLEVEYGKTPSEAEGRKQ